MKAKQLLLAVLMAFLLASCVAPDASPLPTPAPCPTCEPCEICPPESDFGADDFGGFSFSAGSQDFSRLIAKSLVVKQDIEADTLYEYSDGEGVTIDGLTLKDGGIAESFTVAGGLEVTGNLTVSTLVSQSVGFNATGSSAFLTITVSGPLSVTGAVNMDSTLDVDGATTLNSTLDVDGNISSGTGAVKVTDALYVTSTLETVGNVTAGGTLTLESVAFSGPVTFGSASSVVTGTTIAHGLATTPTAVTLTPMYVGAFTNTVYVLATDATSITIGIGYTTGVTTVTSLYWMAGK